MKKDQRYVHYGKVKKRFQAEQIHKEAGLKEADTERFAVKEEYAAEIVPSIPLHREEEQHLEARKTGGNVPVEASLKSRGIGYTAILFALLSLFIWPSFLGPVAAILGFIAYRGGSKSLGAWSILLGLISLTVYFAYISYFV
jgi:hypothetical protein